MNAEVVLVIMDAILSLATLTPHAKRAADKLRVLFATAAAEGRDLSAEEMLALRSDADVADAIWAAAVARAKGTGPSQANSNL